MEFDNSLIKLKDYDELTERGVSVEGKVDLDEAGTEEEAITTIMIEKMLNKLSCLNDYELWLIQEIYNNGKSEREIEREADIPRRTIAYQKKKILLKLRKEMANKRKRYFSLFISQ
jgi:DNA-directed RNA polymerase specialized sigma subunit